MWFCYIESGCAVDAETEDEARQAALEWFAETIDKVISGSPDHEIAMRLEYED